MIFSETRERKGGKEKEGKKNAGNLNARGLPPPRKTFRIWRPRALCHPRHRVSRRRRGKKEGQARKVTEERPVCT